MELKESSSLISDYTIKLVKTVWYWHKTELEISGVEQNVRKLMREMMVSKSTQRRQE